MYIEDKKYEEFLHEIQRIIENKEEFIQRAKNVIRDVLKY